MADLAARAGSTVHPCRGLGSTSPADILLNNHVMPSLARKCIIKSRPQSWYPRHIGRHLLPLRAVNRDNWGPWLWGTLRWPGYGAPWETGPVLCLGCGQRHGLAVPECLLSCPSASRFWDIWTDTWETWKQKAPKWRQTASADELRMCTRLQFPHSLQRSFLPLQAHWRVVVATWHFHVFQRLQAGVVDKLQHAPTSASGVQLSSPKRGPRCRASSPRHPRVGSKHTFRCPPAFKQKKHPNGGICPKCKQ